jgi:hypothetical protein
MSVDIPCSVLKRAFLLLTFIIIPSLTFAIDSDGDGVDDTLDNCINAANTDQRDSNGDGFGNACDADFDGNGFVNFADLGLFKSAFGTINSDADFDGNGFVNFSDLGTFKALFGSPPGPAGSGGSLPGKSSLGINLGPILDFWEDRTFADAMKSSRGFSGPTDAQGWPVAGGTSVVVWHGIDRMNGTYKLIFTGDANVTTGFGNASIQNKIYDSVRNSTTADLLYFSTNGDGLELTFSAPVSDVKLMRPLLPGSSTYYAATETFTHEIKNLISRFSAVRYMDWTATNSNKQATWSDRTLPDDATQQQKTDTAGYGWEGKGASWEYAIMLANETGTDMYISIPARVSDAYISQLAHLIHQGANGFPSLDANLNCYIEYSNEVWNTAGAFEQSQYNFDAAQIDFTAPALNYDGETNNYFLAWRRVGKRTVEISNLFRQEFGDTQMMTRIRPVLAWQLGNPEVGLQALTFIQDNYPQPVNYYIYAGGGSAYYNPDIASNNLSLNNIWTSESFDPNNWVSTGLEDDADLSAAYGIKRIAYEGGPSLDNVGASENVKQTAVSDPRMQDLVMEHHRYWDNFGGGTLFYYLSTHDYQWGFTDNIFDLNTPKLQAIDAITTAAKNPVTHGNRIPGTISGANFNLTNPFWYNSNTLNSSEASWVSYSLNVQQPGTYSFTVNLSGGGTAEVFINGKGQDQVTANGIAGTYSVLLAKGLNGLFVQRMSGTVTVNSIDADL